MRTRSRRLLARLHAATGAPLLALWAFLGLWQQWPSLGGRETYVADPRALAAPGAAAFVAILFAVPFLVHLGCALALARGGLDADVARDDASLGFVSPATRRLQAAAGVLTVAFAVLYLAQTWWPLAVAGASDADVYERLTNVLSTVPYAVAYVVGLAAVGLYLAQGLAAAHAVFWHDGTRPAAPPVAWLCGIVALVFYLGAVNVLSHFVRGGAFVGEHRAGVAALVVPAGRHREVASVALEREAGRRPEPPDQLIARRPG